MKIGNGYNQYINNLRYNKELKENKVMNKIEETSTVKEEAVTVDISEAARQAASSTSSTAFSARVEEIKKAVMEGTYEVSPEKIAEGMVSEMNKQRKG
ncbi:flagellar biosynthesis anti-sigma factor FlgM [Pisciglobus halotolerans]|uniref:Negative regulator of flagellin synthesis n=1 Tax=Pisciglobus halotolerans TaxID=745365 RepID=A0A1I3AND2_9LACT|nr:flagellar biosynthesis anti-sigma factor FlgM [Pisciglobus halotolerans]SFH51638.1 anti-sigma-28 factor, FlgM family [Pisciglobus halotolerans]